MPNEKDETGQPKSDAPEVTTGPDPRDARIAELEEQLTAAGVRLDSAVEVGARQAERIATLEKKLVASKSAPVGDVVYLDGQAHAVLGTYRADNTFVEVKRGYVHEGTTLVNIAKQH